MPLLSNALVTVEEAEIFLRIDPDQDTEIIERLINGISGQFEVETSRKLKRQTMSQHRLDGTGCDTIRLPWTPLFTVSEIVQLNHDGSTAWTITNSESPEQLANSEFTVNPNTGLLRLYGRSFQYGTDNVLVTWDAGYPSSSLEMEYLRTLLLIELEYDYKQSKAGNLGVASKQFQDQAITYQKTDSGLLPRIIRGLDRFRPKRVG